MAIGPKGENLVFLISQPRAGSTLLQRILGSHPKIHTVGESWLLFRFLYPLTSYPMDTAYGVRDEQAALKSLFNESSLSKSVYLSSVRQHLIQLYNKLLEPTSAEVFLDKTPRYYLLLPILNEVFPKAKVILLTRNPLDVFCSIMNTWITENWEKLVYFRYDLIDCLKLIEDYQKSSLSINVSYEKIVNGNSADSLKVMNDIFSSLGLSGIESVKLEDNSWTMGDRSGSGLSEIKYGRVNRWKAGMQLKYKLLLLQYFEMIEHEMKCLDYDCSEVKMHVTANRYKLNLVKKIGLPLERLLENQYPHKSIRLRKYITSSVL